MKIELRFFASLREALGRDHEQADLPAEVQTVADLRLWLAARGEPWASALGSKRAVRAALDQTMVGPGTALYDGAEVAFFPPVTGG
jgi:molybdopterin synthase sulfur carrier subunit